MGQGPLKLRVPEDATILHVGQAASASQGAGTSDLVKGTLVSVKFKSDGQGQGVASQISILATPGSAFVFSGNITFLDLRSKVLVLADPTNDNSYKINFDPARLPMSQDLHEGTQVTVTATFDGGSYVASTINQAKAQPCRQFGQGPELLRGLPPCDSPACQGQLLR